MDKEPAEAIVKAQKAFFRTQVTLDVGWRITQLKKLKAALKEYQPEIEAALAADLGRHETEAYFCDIGTTLLEINEIIRGLRRWAKPETHFSG